MTIYAFDTETHLIQPGNLTPRLVCVQTFCQNTDTKGKVLLRDEGIAWFRNVLSNGHSLIGHNAPFDLAVMAAASPDLFELIIQALEEGRIYCTQIRQMMIDNANGDLKFTSDEDEEGVVKPRKVSFSMQALAKRLLGVHVAKGEETWRLRYAELDGVPVELWPDDAREYAENDPKITSDLFFAQEYRRHDKRCDLLAGQEAQLFDFFALHMTAAWGLRTEKEAVDTFAKYIHEVYTKHANKAKEYGLITEFKGKNKRNMAAIKELVTASYNGDPPRTDKNNVSTNRETLTEANHPGLKAVADAVAAEKLLTTYLPVLRQGETVGINPRYTPILETFRTSCSSPNVQNLPRGGGVRECFVPRVIDHILEVPDDYVLQEGEEFI